MINWPLIGQFLLAAGVGSVIVTILNNFLSPKTKAETRQIAQKTAQDAVDQALAQLRLDVADSRTRAERAEARADESDKRAELNERRVDAMVAERRILVEHVWRLNSWITRHWELIPLDQRATMEPPPTILVSDHPPEPPTSAASAG